MFRLFFVLTLGLFLVSSLKTSENSSTADQVTYESSYINDCSSVIPAILS